MRAMRLAAWAFVVCTALSALGVFLPSVELELAGKAVSKRTSLSLYRANTDRDVARKLIAGYERNTKKRFGAAILTAIMPHTSGHVNEALDDATSAMSTLDGISEDDVKTGGLVFAITLYVFLGLHALMAGLVFRQLMSEVWRRKQIIVALVVAVLVAAIAIGTCLVAREVVWQANDELGFHALGTGIGAYLTPCAALAGLAALGTVLVLHVRTARRAVGRTPAQPAA